MITRRSFLPLLAAPAIVRCASLMQIRGVPLSAYDFEWSPHSWLIPAGSWKLEDVYTALYLTDDMPRIFTGSYQLIKPE